jgi:hypothetical protein
MNNLAIYSQAKQAIAEYKTVDEVKDFRDKAVAIEAYAKQANDFDLERDAAIARVRAERKCGELLSDTEMAKGAAVKGIGRAGANAVPGGNRVTEIITLSDMGITKKQSSKWQKLAAVPENEFEAAINIPGSKPTTNHIIKKPEPEPKRMDKNALWWWGRLLDIEQGKMNTSLNFCVDELTDTMRADAIRIIPKLKQWINEYE